MSQAAFAPLQILEGPSKRLAQGKDDFNAWVATQAPWVEGLSSGLFGAFQGAFLGTLMGSMAKMNAEGGAPGGPPNLMMANMGGPFVQARNFAVMTGTNAGLTAFMRRTRGVDDITNALVAAFGSGACFSLVSGMGAPVTPNPITGALPNPLMSAFSAGVVFALFQGAFYKLGEKFSGPKAEDTDYARVSAMLTNLGLQKWEKNLKKGQLDDRTIMLWDTSALQECRVPPGPRLLILHHLNQYRHGDILRPALPIPGLPKSQ